MDHGIRSVLQHGSPETSKDLMDAFKGNGYEVILSLGEEEENRLGSNCGQYVQRMLREGRRPKDAYEVQRYRSQM
jgi:23S rRNA (adenine2503-C2)-methyltransferase